MNSGICQHETKQILTCNWLRTEKMIKIISYFLLLARLFLAGKYSHSHIKHYGHRYIMREGFNYCTKKHRWFSCSLCPENCLFFVPNKWWPELVLVVFNYLIVTNDCWKHPQDKNEKDRMFYNVVVWSISPTLYIWSYDWPVTWSFNCKNEICHTYSNFNLSNIFKMVSKNFWLNRSQCWSHLEQKLFWNVSSQTLEPRVNVDGKRLVIFEQAHNQKYEQIYFLTLYNTTKCIGQSFAYSLS